MVQLLRTSSNHSTTHGSRQVDMSSRWFNPTKPPQTTELQREQGSGLVSCVVLRFEQVRKSWTTPNSWEIILWSLFPLELSGSRRFGRVEPSRTHVKLLRRHGSVLYYGSNRFGRVEPPRTHEKLSYDPCSLWSSVVQGGSVGLNHPELMRNYPMVLVPCGLRRSYARK